MSHHTKSAYALKTLRSELLRVNATRDLFRKEAQIWIDLGPHPNLVRAHWVTEIGGRLYIAMEHVQSSGGRPNSLEGYLEKRPPSLAQALAWAIQFCHGMEYAVSRGVRCHRDVKPANILVTSDGRVKLLDFGLARVAFRETITKRGIVLGTPDYMSPEQAMGKDIDHRTDIFSAGAVFYEFLTARKPFPGKTLHSVLYKIIQGAPEPLLALCPELPARLALVVHRMLEKEPKKRYGSMEDVGRDLAQIHAALRRSHGRSALPSRPAPPLSPDEQRTRVRDRLKQGRALFAQGEWALVVGEMRQALEVDSTCQEAAELLWGAGKKLVSARPDRTRDERSEARVSALLAQATPEVPEAEARRAIAELSLVAPDDPRLGQLLHERAHAEED
jgi:serine/threonine-protein kinase